MKKWIPIMATLLIAGVCFTWTARSNDDDKRRDGDKPREGQRGKPRERDRDRPGDQREHRERDDQKTEREEDHKIRQFIEQAERKINELRKQGKHEEAIVYYDAAIEADKRIADELELEESDEGDESTMLLYCKAESLTALGRDEEAKQCVDRAEELEPYGYPQPPLPQGMELAKQGKHEKAIEVYTAEIESGKKIRCNENTLLLYYKAVSLTALGRDEEAKQCVDRAKELDPNWQPPSKPENK